jgi:hypothetical protein
MARANARFQAVLCIKVRAVEQETAIGGPAGDPSSPRSAKSSSKVTTKNTIAGRNFRISLLLFCPTLSETASNT